MTKLLTLLITLTFVSCTYTSYRVHGPPRGYCFKAEGVSKLRCYETSEACFEKQSVISDQHPWAKIEQECYMHNPPLPGN